MSANAKVVALQLGNLYGLMCLLGLVILNTTSERKVVRRYLVCLAIADLGHTLPLMWFMGWDRVLDVGAWNSMAWGNIAATWVLFAMRLATLLGVFGHIPHDAKSAAVVTADVSKPKRT